MATAPRGSVWLLLALALAASAHCSSPIDVDGERVVREVRHVMRQRAAPGHRSRSAPRAGSGRRAAPTRACGSAASRAPRRAPSPALALPCAQPCPGAPPPNPTRPQLTELAKFSDHPNPAVTRILFTPNDMLARAYIKELMQEAGLAVR
jgi:hypothetical protein